MAFFFFQAEDGIRDYKVTGVQTCALPIWAGRPEAGAVPGEPRGGTRQPGGVSLLAGGSAAQGGSACRRAGGAMESAIKTDVGMGASTAPRIASPHRALSGRGSHPGRRASRARAGIGTLAIGSLFVTRPLSS